MLGQHHHFRAGSVDKGVQMSVIALTARAQYLQQLRDSECQPQTMVSHMYYYYNGDFGIFSSWHSTHRSSGIVKP